MGWGRAMFSRLLLLLVVSCLPACALFGPESPAPSDAPFDLVGRVAVNSDGRAFSSNVRWQHSGAREEVWLLTPLGQTLAHIVSDSDGATLTAADQKQYRAAS